MANLPKFPLPYVFEVEKGLKFATQEVKFESGKKQVRQLSANAQRTWSISLRGTTEQQKQFEQFCESVGGNTRQFIFVDEFGKEQICRFATNEFNMKVIRDFNSGIETYGFAVGSTANVQIEKVL